MQEVALYDPNRKPPSWMDVIQPGQYAAFFSDMESGVEMTSAGGYFDTGMIASCLIFDSLEESEQYCTQRVEDIPQLRCDVFDSQGRANPPVATIVNPRHQHKLESEAQARRLMRWGWTAIVVSLPLYWFAFTRRGEAWIAGFFGMQLTVAGLRVLHWGYSVGEELRYRKEQSDLRKQQITAKAGRV